MNRARLALLGCVLLVAAAVPASAGIGAPVKVNVGPPLPAGCNVSPTGTVFTGAAVEPQIAVNPRRPNELVAVYQQDRWSNGGANAVLASVSQDDGKHWGPSVSPPFSRCTGGSYDRASNPWVSTGPDGTAYFVALGLSNDILTSAILVSRSHGGRTWGPVATLAHDTFSGDLSYYNDRPSVVADPTDSSYAYVVWTRGWYRPADNRQNAFTYFSRTTDHGLTWEPAKPIHEAGLDGYVIGSQLHVLPGGTLVHTATGFAPDGSTRILVQRSSDRGATWSSGGSPGTAGTRYVTDPRDGAMVRTSEVLTYGAADPRPGRRILYLVWQDARFTAGAADSVVLSRSGDGGLTWSAPVRVSPAASGQAFTPAVAVDQAGRVNVVYYDFTFDTTTGPLETDFWLARSTDGGQTFEPRQRITPSSFDMRTTPAVSRGFFIGDNPGLTTNRSSVLISYSDTRIRFAAR